uniref:DUF2490 domain-containing protein n=1 Tax=candidate division WOR-3 bacterium TaxID=2052148 RepID=A0A7C4UBK1_UNCW3
MKKLIPLIFLSLSLLPQVNTFRLWSYFNLNFKLSSDFVFTILPGLRYEVLREKDNPKGFYMFEFFTGFSYFKSIKGINGRFPIFYYYINFPNDDYYVQSIEFLPSFQKRFGNFLIFERTIFHNRFYSNFYEDRTGYSLLIRELIQLKYINFKYPLNIGIEPFIGIIEDNNHNPSPFGFTPKGLNSIRFYFGIDFPLFKNLALSTNYVFEPTYSQGELTGKNHYIFFNITFNK